MTTDTYRYKLYFYFYKNTHQTQPYIRGIQKIAKKTQTVTGRSERKKSSDAKLTTVKRGRVKFDIIIEK